MPGMGMLCDGIGVHTELTMGGGGFLQLLGCLITLIVGNEAVGCNLAALGIVSLLIMAVVRLSSGMARVLLDGVEFGVVRASAGAHCHVHA